MTFSTSAVAVCCCSDFERSSVRILSSFRNRVLDRNRGLRGEVFDKLDLLVGKTPDFLPIDDYDADQLVVLDHRNCENRSGAGELDGAYVQRSGSTVTLFLSNIGYLNCLPGRGGTSKSGAGHSTRKWLAAMKFGVCRRSAMHGAHTKRIAFSQPKIAKFRSAKTHGILEDDLEYGCKVASR